MPSIVRTGLAHHLWSQAQTSLEWATTRFWEHIIRAMFTVEDDWVVASQQPPTDDPQDRRRVELVVDKWTDKSVHRLFIFEAKKQSASQTEIETLEYQAYEACITHLNYSRREQMYAMTTIGTMARLWVVHKDEDYLIPWISMGTTLADKSGYIEAHGSEGSQIEDGINYMKKNAKMSQRRLDELLRSVSSAVQCVQPSSSNTISTATQPASHHTGSHGSGPVYTPIHPAQDNSGASTSGFGSGYPPTLRMVSSSPTSDPQAAAEVAQHHRLVPDDAVYVVVKIEVKDSIVNIDGKSYDCVLYTGKTSGKHFWTYSLRDLEPFAKEKKTKGKGRA